MNKKILSTLTLGTVLLSFVACSQDDGTDGNKLPEGKYPLQIASVTLTAESGGQGESIETEIIVNENE